MSGSTLAATPVPPPAPNIERRRLRVLYTGSDERIWSLLEQIPFIIPERTTIAEDGDCPVRGADQTLRCDAVVIDQQPGEASPVAVVKSVKAQASHVSVLVLAPPDAPDVETAALDLGAETVSKTGIYRRKLVAALKQSHQRFEIVAQHQALAAREARLRQIVETLPQGIGVLSKNFSILAVNTVALELLGASKPTEAVGRDFTAFVVPERRADVVSALQRMGQGEQTTVRCDLVDDGKRRRAVEISGVALGREASGGRSVLIAFREPEDSGINGEQLDVLIARLEEADRRKGELEAELEAARNVSASATRALETKLDGALAKLREAEADLARRSDAEAAFADTLTRERAAWEEARYQLDAALQAANAERDGLIAERDDIAASRNRLDEEIGTVRLQAEQAERARQSLEHQLAEANAARGDLQRQLADVTAVHTALDRRAADITAQLGDLEAAHAAAKARLTDAIAAIRERDALDAALIVLTEHATSTNGQAAGRARAAQVESGGADDFERARRQLQARGAELQIRVRDLLDELERVHASRARLKDSPLVGYARMTRDGRLVECNDTLARILGYADASEALARQRAAGLPGFPSPLATPDSREPERQPHVRSATLPRADGKMIRVREIATVVPVDGGEDLIERIVVDMSAALRVEDELRQARRLEEVGSLAACMAPDIENQLRQVAEAGAELRRSMAPEDPRRQSVDSLVGSTEDAVSLLRQLAAFSQRQSRPLETIDLNEAVRRAEPTLRRLAGSHVEFKMELGAAGSIMQTEGELDQLLTALVVNARDVLLMGGSVTVATDLIEKDAARAPESPDAPAGVHAVVVVSAHGYRSQRATLSASVETLARRCGGVISVTSDTERSTSFEVRFPSSKRD